MPLQCICVDNRISRTQLGNYLFSVSKVSETITRKSTLLICAPLATSSLTFFDSQLDTRDSRLETRYSRLETRYSILETIEYRVSRLEARGTVNLLLSGTVHVTIDPFNLGGLLPHQSDQLMVHLGILAIRV